MYPSVPDRFLNKISPEPNSGCFLWTGALSGTGYGSSWDKRQGKVRPAHIIMWERENGPVPKGMELDHKCRVPSCVNPRHLEPVSHRENLRRGSQRGGVILAALQKAKTECPRGHEYTAQNTYVLSGRRSCRTCHRIREVSRRERNRRHS